MADSCFCFPRSARLTSPRDYSRVFNKADRSSDGFFTILFRANDSQQARIGLAISKKSLKRAVDRNLVKRIVRESFRQHRDALPGFDIVVLSRKGIAARDRAALFSSLQSHWTRIGSRQLKQ